MAVLKINGKERHFPQALPATLDELLSQLDIEAATVVAEIDRQIIERVKFTETPLADGQNIELIRFVPGG